ncbi:MAG: ArsA family ATPase [Polyangiaceae bacterium]|nr:ArsA family ATPase [Polyangiaceae bacterium]
MAKRRVILCVGCGGVGKTTIAAAIALAAARQGKRVLCMTIDPARRLANSLGLERMATEETTVPRELFAAAGLEVAGELTVVMLDTKRTFDDLVTRHASNAAARDRILSNRLYRYISTTLAGTQEYMAMEKLLAVQSEGRFDLVVLDTPPTSNALDFLDAPDRMVGALDSAAMRWFIEAFQSTGRLSLNLVARSVSVVLRGIGRLTGGGFLEQMAELITELDDLFGGFRARAHAVAAAFRSPEFAYVVVTTPAPAALREAEFFAERLREQGMSTDALVVNRVHRRPRAQPSDAEVGTALAAAGIALGEGGVARLQRALHEEESLASADTASLASLERSIGADRATIRVDVPALPGDVHDLGTLAGISTLVGG